MAAEPIACTLTPAELAARQDGLLPGLGGRALRVEPLEHGYRLAFAADPSILGAIAAVIESERACCRFLRFSLTVAADDDIVLDVTGPAGTRAVLDALFAV